MTYSGLITFALIIATRLIVWPAVKARSISKLLRSIVIAVAIVAGIPLILSAAILAIPFVILLVIRNLFVNYLSSKLFNHKRFYVIDSEKITANKLAVYNNYAGSMDVFLRSGTKEDKVIMNDRDWVLIDNFIHDIWLAKSGQLSALSLEQLEMTIFKACASISVAARLKRMNWQNYHDSKKGVIDKVLNWLFP